MNKAGCRARWRLTNAALLLCSTLASPPAAAQDSEAAVPDESDPNVIIVTGYRNSAIKRVAPLATLDEDAIAATNATNMSDLLKAVGPVAKSADGAEPIFLLNGQRISSYQEVGTLPPEAIAKMEVLPEPEALRFGYPPTRRVLNFITKPRFQQTEVSVSAGRSMRPGSPSGSANLGVTRLRNSARFSVNLEHKRTGPLLHSERTVVPDPDIIFDATGNVTAPGGGEIDPALSDIFGQPVAIAPAPIGVATPDLADFAAYANQPRLFRFGRLATITPENRSSKAELTWGDRIFGVGATLNLAAERSRDDRMSGPESARLLVPSNNPYSPFGEIVMLNRYLTEVSPLRQVQATTKLRAAGTLRGAIAGWRWDLTGSVEQQTVRGTSELRIDLADANAAIAAGANPFVPLRPEWLDNRLTNHSRLRTRNLGAKTVVTNSPFRLPAGEATVTATAEIERADANSRTRGADPFKLDLGRTRQEAGLALDLPLASRTNKVLEWAGDLSLNASATSRHVSGYGFLADRTTGLSWGPFERVQLLFQNKRIGTAPPLDQLASPFVSLIDFPIFDYAAGRTELVDATMGGNPDLRAERRHTRSIALTVQPWKKRQWRLSATYEDIEIRDQTGVIRALTPRAESVLPDLFVRDEDGRLISASYRPTNFYLERLKQLNFNLSFSGQIGKAPPEGEGARKPPSISYYGGIGPTIRLSDKLQLRRGTPAFDLLNGDTVQGWGMGRVSTWYYLSVNHPAGGFQVDGWYGGKYRVITGNPESDLYTSPLLKVNVSAQANMLYLFKGREWARKLQLKVEVQNLLDSWARGRDGLGRTPNRSQRAFTSEAVGRTLMVSLRKRFQPPEKGAGKRGD